MRLDGIPCLRRAHASIIACITKAVKHDERGKLKGGSISCFFSSSWAIFPENHDGSNNMNPFKDATHQRMQMFYVLVEIHLLLFSVDARLVDRMRINLINKHYISTVTFTDSR